MKSLAQPPADPVEWAIRMPDLTLAEKIEPRARVKPSPPTISRRIPRVVHVRAKGWFGARRAAALYWASKGVHFNPQTIRDATVTP